MSDIQLIMRFSFRVALGIFKEKSKKVIVLAAKECYKFHLDSLTTLIDCYTHFMCQTYSLNHALRSNNQ
jgi:hypothetical protein